MSLAEFCESKEADDLALAIYAEDIPASTVIAPTIPITPSALIEAPNIFTFILGDRRTVWSSILSSWDQRRTVTV